MEDLAKHVQVIAEKPGLFAVLPDHNAFPISVSGVEDVLAATRSVHDKIEKLSRQKNVCFSEPENDDKINETSPSSFMNNS